MIIVVPVVRVLLTEDRAQVTRTGTFAHAGGHRSLQVEGVSPLAVDASVQVSVDGGDAVSVARTAVRRVWRVPERDAARADQALAEVRRERQKAVQRARRAVERAEVERAAVMAELALFSQLSQRNAVRGVVGDGLAADLDALRARTMAVTERATAERAVLAERVDDLESLRQGPVQEGRAGTPVLTASLEVVVDAPPGELTLTISYLVPSALWRPAYAAHLDTRGAGGPTVRWEVFGTVWQRTGEDWDDVELVLSTARSSAGATLPPLHEDQLSMGEKSRAEARTIHAGFRDQAIDKASVSAGEAPSLPGVDDGGEARVLRAGGWCTVPSDGRPHRVLVGEFTGPARTAWRCTPELQEAVFRTATLTNAFRAGEDGVQPLLAGPVVLLVDGVYSGLGEVPFVAPGEAFTQSFGSGDDVIVRTRRTHRLEERFARADHRWFVTETELTHTGDAPITVALTQRVPVSELEQVTVHLAPDPDGPQRSDPDDRGHVRWSLELEPGSTTAVEFAFRIEKTGRVALPDPW